MQPFDGTLIDATANGVHDRHPIDEPVTLRFSLAPNASVDVARRKIGPLHSALRRIFPRQFDQQEYTKTHFRRYRFSVPLPEGWRLSIEISGPNITLSFIPPRKEALD